MTQLALPLTAQPNRWELGHSRTTWREPGGTLRIVTRYPRCVDYAWPWWTPDWDV